MTAKKPKLVKPAKAKKAPAAKRSRAKGGRKDAAEKAAQGSLVGHNSNAGLNKPLLALFDNFAKLDENKKQIAKAQRDIRAKAKEEHGVQSNVFNHQVKLRKMDSDVRVQFEQGNKDVDAATGYQFALALQGAGDEEGGEGNESAGGNDDNEEEGEGLKALEG